MLSYHISYVIAKRGPLTSERHTFRREVIRLERPPTEKDLVALEEQLGRPYIASYVDITILGFGLLAEQ